MYQCEFCERAFFEADEMFEHFKTCRARRAHYEHERALKELEETHHIEIDDLMRVIRDTENIPSDGYRLLNIKIKLLHEQIQRIIRQNQLMLERVMNEP